MTANYFEVTLKYMRVNECNQEKKITEKYLVEAMTYTEAEARIIAEAETIISGDFCIPSIKKSNIVEVIESGDVNDDRYYLAKVAITDADEVSGKEKSATNRYLVKASDLDRALERLKDSLKSFMVPWESVSISDTKIIEVFYCQPE